MNNSYLKYYAFAQSIFNYLNGKLNTVNKISKLEIAFENTDKYAYTDNSRVVLFLWSILVDYTEERFIKPIIVDVISHELAHLDQIIDGQKYKEDSGYRDMIENQAIMYSSTYIVKNYNDIVMACGYFDSTRFINIVNDIKSKNIGLFKKTDLCGLYKNSLLAMNSAFANINFDNYDTVAIRFVDTINGGNSIFLIKYNGSYSTDTQKFNDTIISQTCGRAIDIIGEEGNVKDFGKMFRITLEASAPVTMVNPIRKIS